MDDLLADALLRLPHGPEFRFLDRLLTLQPGKCATAEYLVRGDEPFLRGHFPGCPLFPGVLLVEAAAQLAGVIAQSDPAHRPYSDLRLTALKQVKITGTALPKETLLLEATITGRLGNLIQAQASAAVSSRTVLVAELTLSGQIVDGLVD